MSYELAVAAAQRILRNSFAWKAGTLDDVDDFESIAAAVQGRVQPESEYVRFLGELQAWLKKSGIGESADIDQLSEQQISKMITDASGYDQVRMWVAWKLKVGEELTQALRNVASDMLSDTIRRPRAKRQKDLDLIATTAWAVDAAATFVPFTFRNDETVDRASACDAVAEAFTRCAGAEEEPTTYNQVAERLKDFRKLTSVR